MFLFNLGAYFGCKDVTDDVIIESSECFLNFRKCISVTLSWFGQIFTLLVHNVAGEKVEGFNCRAKILRDFAAFSTRDFFFSMTCHMFQN